MVAMIFFLGLSVKATAQTSPDPTGLCETHNAPNTTTIEKNCPTDGIWLQYGWCDIPNEQVLSNWTSPNCNVHVPKGNWTTTAPPVGWCTIGSKPKSSGWTSFECGLSGGNWSPTDPNPSAPSVPGNTLIPATASSPATTSAQLGDCTFYPNGLNSVPETDPNYTKADCVIKGPAQDPTWTGYYYFLAPLKDVGTNDNNGTGPMINVADTPDQPTSLGNYLNPMIALFIGICAVLAMIMIVMGGIEYMTSELISNKEAGKERIRNAIFGLLLALCAWTLLYTINPNLLKSDINAPAAKAFITSLNFASSPSTYLVPLGKTGQASGTNCDENIVSTSNQTASAGLNSSQIHTLTCIGGIESGCQSAQTYTAQNYNWNNGSSAYGPFQILLQTNAGCFENSVCQQAAGVSGPLNCAAGFSGGNPIPGSPIAAQCTKAANNLTCSVAAAACLIKQSPNYSPWNANPNLSKCL